MKKKKMLIIALLLLFNVFSLMGQNYLPVLEEGKQWTIKSENLSGAWTDTLKIEKDTLVDNVTFKVINTPYKTVYLTENTENRKVEFFTDDDETLRLVMDMSLVQGDTFYVEGASFNNPGYYEVDSVYEKDDRKHVQINYPVFYADNEKLTFIEGIGTNLGLYYKDMIAGDMNNYLLCAWENENKIYSNDYYDGECNVSLSMSNENNKDKIAFFYTSQNPVNHNGLEVFFNYPFTGRLNLFDITGKIILENRVKNTTHKLLTLPKSKKRGIYLLNVISSTGESQTMKIIF